MRPELYLGPQLVNFRIPFYICQTRGTFSIRSGQLLCPSVSFRLFRPTNRRWTHREDIKSQQWLAGSRSKRLGHVHLSRYTNQGWFSVVWPHKVKSLFLKDTTSLPVDLLSFRCSSLSKEECEKKKTLLKSSVHNWYYFDVLPCVV